MGWLAGLDGCRGGWVCVLEEEQTGRVEALILPRVEGLVGLAEVPELVAVDIPIGLPEAGPRLCDRAARRLLGPGRGGSVFPAPIRGMLAAASYAQACEIGLARDGRKLSRQTWNILPKIREVDAFVRGGGGRADWVWEVHPELCFQQRAWGQPLRYGKKSDQGRAEREGLLEAGERRAFGRLLRGLAGGPWARDDLLDAFAALGAARRIRRGEAQVLPETGQCDGCGLPMRIAF